MQSPPTPPLRLRPDLSDLSTLIDYIESTGEACNFRPADTMAFAIAAEELFANTLNHSSPPATAIEFTLTCADGLATALYTDDAAPFDPTAAEDADTTLPLDQRRIGGLGIHIIRKSMPTFTYQRIETPTGDRNQTTFARPIKP